MLQVEQVSKKFGKKVALHEISFSLGHGIIGLLGPNGAGKTTLLRILATFYHPTNGSISMDGLSWLKNAEEVRKKIGYMPQHIGLFPLLTVEEYLSYVSILRGMNKDQFKGCLADVLEEVNLLDYKKKKIKSLSGGMKQRVGIAQAIIHDPQLLLVDEPTAGLDPEERIRFRNLIKRLAVNRTVIFSTHITEDISMTCDQVILIQDGKAVMYDTVHKIIDLAKEKVWEMRTDSLLYNSLLEDPEKMIVHTQSLQEKDEVSFRIISENKPHESAQSVEPRLEEGYMVWLKEK